MAIVLPSFLTTNKGISISIRDMTKDYPPHSHTFYEIELIISGKGHVILNGQKYEFSDNTLFFFTPLDFEVMELYGEVKLLNIAFSPEWIKDSLTDDLIFPTVIYDYFFPYTQRIHEEYINTYSFNQAAVESMLTIMLVDITRSILETKMQDGERYNANIRRAMQYIQLHFKENITLMDVANYVYLNPSYFSSQFKKVTNMSFLEYLHNLRLTYAKQMLTYTKIPVTDICYNSGFTSFSNFSRSFKQSYDISPREFRKLHANSITSFEKPIDLIID